MPRKYSCIHCSRRNNLCKRNACIVGCDISWKRSWILVYACDSRITLSLLVPFHICASHILYFLFIHIQIPHSLFKENGYDHREALFGKPAYGGSIAQNVFYAQQDFCSDDQADPSKGVPIRPTDPETGKMAAWPSPFILMIDRGSCTFVKKVRFRFC